MDKKVLLLVISICILLPLGSGCLTDFSDSSDTFDYSNTMLTLYDLYDEQDYEGMVQVASEYLDGHDVNQDNFKVLMYRASAYSYLGENELAIDDYEAVLPFVYALDNVAQREYSTLFFSLGILHTKVGNADEALQYYEYGLQLEPSSNYFQILFGQIYEDLSMDDEALEHYLDLQESLPLVKEEEVLLQMKIDRLTGEEPDIDFEIPDSYCPNYTIKIIPINDFSANVDLEDISLLITSKFRVACEVLTTLEIPESEILNETRNQYDASKIIDYLESTLNESVKYNSFPIAITDYDMFAGTANFIFSQQDYDADMGVISSYMFEITLPAVNESDILLGRRIGIQFLSTVGQLFGSDRPTRAECPLAYPHSIDEFTRKNSKLCDETQSDVDARMQQWEQWLVLYTEQEKANITEVYEKYYFE